MVNKYGDSSLPDRGLEETIDFLAHVADKGIDTLLTSKNGPPIILAASGNSKKDKMQQILYDLTQKALDDGLVVSSGLKLLKISRLFEDKFPIAPTQISERIAVHFVKTFGFRPPKDTDDPVFRDQRVIFEIAKLCAKQSGGFTARIIKEFGIKDQQALIDIAKLCAQQSGKHTARYIKNFGIKDQQALIEIAKLCAQQSGWDTAEYIKNFGIKDQQVLIELAKLCAQQDGEDTAECIKDWGGTPEYIKDFGIQDQQVLIEIAKLCAKQSGGGTARHIKEFGIKDQQALIEIAKLCAQQSGRGTAWHIKEFGIQDQQALIEIAKLCAKQSGGDTAEYIKNFGIQDQQALIKIAKLCAQQYGWGTAKYIKNFGIQDQQALIEIAKLCAQESGGDTAEYIKNFGIQNQQVLIELAKLCAQQDGGGTAQHIKNFGIQNQQVLIELAKLCAKQDGWGTAQHIKNFGIQNQQALIEIAKLCAKQSGGGTAQHIKNFGIQKEQALIEIAKLCAKQSGGGTAEHIKNFGIQNAQVRYEILQLAVGSDFKAFQFYKNFQLPEKKILPDPKLTDVLSSDAPEKEKRRQLFSAIERFADTFNDKHHSVMKSMIQKVANLEPHTQREAAWWLLGSLFLMRDLEPNSLDWTMRFWKVLGELREPELRKRLTLPLISLSHEPEIAKGLPSRLQLAAIPLIGLHEQGIHKKTILAIPSKLKNLYKNKESKLRDVRIRQLIYWSLHHLSSADSLSIEDKSKILNDMFSSEIGEKEVIKNAISVKGLFQLQEIKRLKQHGSLPDAFCQAFEELLQLPDFDGDFITEYDKIFGCSRNPDALMSYAAGLKSLNDETALTCLGSFTAATLKGKLFDLRYSTENNPHLKKVFDWKEGTCEIWTRPLEVSVADFIESKKKEKAFDFGKWLQTKLIVDRHLGVNVKVPYLMNYLKATSDKERKAESTKLGQMLKEKSKMRKENPEKVVLLLQNKCMRLLKEETKLNKKQLIKKLREMQNIVEGREFSNDLKGLIRQFETEHAPTTAKLKASITDDPIDLLLCGTDVVGSCQRVDSDPELNRGLLGYMIDGKNQLAAVKDDQGKTIARCLLRLLWDGEQPVLYRERFYPSIVPREQKLALNALAKKRAEELKVPLLCAESEETQGLYPKTLHALGGPAPYEYCDGLNGVQFNGYYTINNAHLL